MKAVICTKYGPPEVLQLKKVAKPVPKNSEVLVKVFATAVNSGDCRMRSLHLNSAPMMNRIAARLILGAKKPRNPILGLILAGEIESTGIRVKKYKKGDRVYGRTPNMRFGAYAEYICLPENSTMELIPANTTYEEAAAIPFGGFTALYFLKKGKIGSGRIADSTGNPSMPFRKKVLICGASGAVGSSAVQLAKYYGAEVVGVCSTGNLEWVKSLGADAVIDYTKEDFTASTELYDLIFDAVGKISYSKSKRALKPKGKYVSVLESSGIKTKDLVSLTKLVEAGKLKPVIDRSCPLEQIVEAHRYVEQGHKKGNVIITVDHDDRIQ